MLQSLRAKNNTTTVTFRREIGILTYKERLIFLLLCVATMTFFIWDVSADFAGDASVFHIAIDLFFGLAATGSFLLLAARLGNQRLLSSELLARTYREKEVVSAQAHQWKSKATQLQDGISEEIDDRMDQWKLSVAEKEIGLLLLKGLSIREVSELRGTSERTVRQQSLAIYAKAGVAGRAELSAYFLEDFLDRKLDEAPRHNLDL